MITYIVQTLLCSAVLFLIYVLLLEREKMHRFNRFYLLFSIVFSFTVSFIPIKSPLPKVSVSEMMMPATQAPIVSPAPDFKQAPAPAPIEEKKLLPNLLLLLYIIGTSLFLFRFIRNLSLLSLKVLRNQSLAYHGAALVLTNDHAVPHSFMKYIFIDKEKFEQGTIEKEILQHELTHVNQKHSIDILAVELLMVFAWINPLLFLYRKAMLLNHEYLADEAVLKTFHDADSYRLLLFSKASQTNNLVLSSPFNYLITKKRLIMMTKKTSQKVAILKQIAVIPLIAAIGFLFSSRVIAQDNPKQPVKQSQVFVSQTDAPQSVIDEYHAIIAKYKIDTLVLLNKILGPKASPAEKKEWAGLINLDTLKKLDKFDRARLEFLFSQMSKKQQNHQFLIFYPKPEIISKLVPTKAQMELWKNPRIYGIWVGYAKRIKNSALNNYTNTDFAHYTLRKLNKDEAKIMKYQVEVALMSKDIFEKTRARALAVWKMDEYKSEMVIVIHPKKSLEKIN